MDFEMRYAREDDIPVLVDIWSEVFGDPKEYIELFYRENFKRMTVLVRTLNDIPVGMLHFFPGEIVSKDRRQKAYLGYAGAARTQYKGKGVLKPVFMWGYRLADENGYAVIFKPANEPLSNYYKTMGMVDDGYWNKAEFTDCGTDRRCELCFISPEEYNAMREERLKDYPHFKWSDEHIAWSIKENDFCGGRTVKTVLDGKEHFALIAKYDDRINIAETSLSYEELKSIAGYLKTVFDVKTVSAVLMPGDNTGNSSLTTISYNADFLGVYTNLVMI